MIGLKLQHPIQRALRTRKLLLLRLQQPEIEQGFDIVRGMIQDELEFFLRIGGFTGQPIDLRQTFVGRQVVGLGCDGLLQKRIRLAIISLAKLDFRQNIGGQC